MEFKKCRVCKIEKTKENFSKKKNACKQCRAINSKDNYKNTRLAERQIKRKEFFELMEQRAIDEKTEFNFRELFIEEEKLALMRLQTDLYFCEVPEQIAKQIRETEDFINGYVLKHIWISDYLKNTVYTRIVI